MAKIQYHRLLGATILLMAAACQPDPPQQTAHLPIAPSTSRAASVRPVVVPPPAHTEPKELTLEVPRHLRSHRRYVGTLGGQEAVLELLPVDNQFELLTSSLYFVHEPHTELFSGSLKGPGGPPRSLRMGFYSDTSTATLLLLPPFGPTLRTTWTGHQGAAPEVVTWHENYAGAVRYEVLTVTATGHVIPPRVEHGDTVESSHLPAYTRTYLHLLGPDTLRPARRRLQALPPRRMYQAVRHQLLHEMEGGCEFTEGLTMSLNGYDLLSYRVSLYDYMFGSPHGNRTEDLRTVDLRTGRPVRWQTWFRDGTEAAQRRLIYRRMLATGDTADYPPGTLDPRTGVRELPEQYDLTPEGIVAHYGDYMLGGSYSRGTTDVLLPYNEAAPLLNRGTPLDRILAARSLRAGR